MKAEDVCVDLEELEEFKKKNAEDRMRFISFWANYIKTHSDVEWSSQQADLINSQIKSARSLIKNYSKEEEIMKLATKVKVNATKKFLNDTK